MERTFILHNCGKINTLLGLVHPTKGTGKIIYVSKSQVCQWHQPEFLTSLKIIHPSFPKTVSIVFWSGKVTTGYCLYFTTATWCTTASSDQATSIVIMRCWRRYATITASRFTYLQILNYSTKHLSIEICYFRELERRSRSDRVQCNNPVMFHLTGSGSRTKSMAKIVLVGLVNVTPCYCVVDWFRYGTLVLDGNVDGWGVVMPATAMFSNFKSRVGGGGTAPQNILDHNPITQYFEIGKQTASAGPELVWRIYDAYRKSDGKEVSVFVFEKKCAEKLHKPKRKETVTELLRGSVRQLERSRHPKILQLNITKIKYLNTFNLRHVIHSVEESGETLAFASEPVLASLANILAYQEGGGGGPGGPATGASQLQTAPRHPHAKEYHFLDIELKYGILQITEALSFLHYSGHVLHRNVCPSSILVTKKGTWKLGGLEFTERSKL
uniref:Protein kinase domain-containing protein n=1 Tax=Rhodnius prolixus TaxID=13249 RepID=T1HAT6_RHOPR